MLFYELRIQNNFTRSCFAKEDLSWKTEGGAEFSWRAGKKIEQEQLQMFLSSEDDVLQKAKRENWLEKESAGHFSFTIIFYTTRCQKIYIVIIH